MLVCARRNIAKNNLAPGAVRAAAPQQQQQQKQQQHSASFQLGSAEVAALEWGAPGYMDTVASLSQEKVDLVVATDCIYIDPSGSIPSSTHFMAAAAGLCKPITRVLITFEARSDQLRQALLSDAKAQFSRVEQVPLERLPEHFRVQHIEMYELGLTAGAQGCCG